MWKIACLFLLIAGLGAAQPLQPLGIGLEMLPYPYPVHFIPLTIEAQDLRMAYMDVPAAAPNGRPSFSCTARISAATTSPT